MTHKGWELYGRAQLARQNGERTFIEPETGREVVIDDLTVESAIAHAAPLYPGGDAADAAELLYKLLTDNHGEWHPGNHTIIAPELFFDQELPGEWAEYEFPDPRGGPPIRGRLRIRGTMDLLVSMPSGLTVYADLKTGRPYWSWAKGREKTFDDLMADEQLLLYYRALRTLRPGDEPMMCIIYVRPGGGVSYLPYGEEQERLAIDLLRQTFDEIRQCQKPKRRMDEPGGGPWKQPCSFCHFSKAKAPTGQSLCDYYHGELLSLGMERCTAKHARGEPWLHYSEGGGKTHSPQKSD
jgi:hypothetical protein